MQDNKEWNNIRDNVVNIFDENNWVKGEVYEINK